METNSISPKVILFVTIDCLRYDRLGFDGYERSLTPNIDRLANEGVLFTDTFANYPSTGGSIPGLLLSKYPWEGNEPEEVRKSPSLHGELRKQGYRTAAIHTNPFLTRYYGWGEDFDYFFDDLEFQPDLPIPGLGKAYRKIWKTARRLRFKGGSISASELNSKAKKYIKNNIDKKIFLYLHYMDVHEPYFPPGDIFRAVTGNKLTLKKKFEALNLFRKLIPEKDYINELSERKKEFIVNLYDSSVKYVDEEIGNLLKFLSAENLLKDALIILTSDHGQELGERGMFAHTRLYDEVLHVPFIVYHPDLSAETIKSQIRVLDIPPSILNLLNVSIPNDFRGEKIDLNLSRNKGRPVISSFLGKGTHKKVTRHWSLRTPNYKLILHYGPPPQLELKERELYDLKSDPAESKNIADERENVTETLKQELDRVVRSVEI